MLSTGTVYRRQCGLVDRALEWESGDLSTIPSSATDLRCGFLKITVPFPPAVSLVYLQCELFGGQRLSPPFMGIYHSKALITTEVSRCYCNTKNNDKE